MNICQLKKKLKLKTIGLMSGTSMDGLDISYITIEKTVNSVKSSMIKYKSYDYEPEFKKYIQNQCTGKSENICRANFDISRKWSDMIDKFIMDNSIDLQEIDLIGSHGQTIWHSHGHSTLQIGEPAVIAERFKKPVISNFRVADVAAGGSGAPLVPFIDYLLFKDYNKDFLLLNIGGIANFTIIPARANSVDDVYALDTGPGNGLIDTAMEIATDGKHSFDKDGKWARSGNIKPVILDELNSHPYLEKDLPKSTGKEEFGKEYTKYLIKKHHVNKKQGFQDLIATLTFFTAKTIYGSYQKYFADKYSLDEIIVSGGGANNPVIMKYLKELFDDVKFSAPESYNLDIDAKESMAFAILAALRVWEIPANVPNVTGATKPVLLGNITYQGE